MVALRQPPPRSTDRLGRRVARHAEHGVEFGPAQALAAITMNVEFIKRLLERGCESDLVESIRPILRAGFVVVNVNPLYTARELEHQLKDSGATTIVIVENFAHTLEQVIAHTQLRQQLLKLLAAARDG